VLPPEHPRWRRYLWFFRPDARREADDEIAFHLDRLTDDLIRAEGLSRAEARARAERRFGDVPAIRRDLHRRATRRNRRRDRWERIGDLVRDLRIAGRRLRREPGYSGAVVAVLALGLGATSTMFSALDATLFRPLPFSAPERLVTAEVPVPFQPDPAPSGTHLPTLADTADLRPIFERTAAYAAGGLNLADAERPARVRVGVVTAGFFETLGVHPLVGRTFAPEEGRPGGPPVVVLSRTFWQRHYGGDSVLGRTLRLGKRSYTVIGVMGRGFSFPAESDLWIPLTVPSTFDTFEPFRSYLPSTSIGRLAPGLDWRTADRRLLGLWERALGAVKGPDQDQRIAERLDRLRREGTVYPFRATLTGDRGAPLLILFGATTLLLLVACANVTNLILARAAGRRQELAIFAALGASRGRIARQLLIESLILAGAGALAGLALVPPALQVITALTPRILRDLSPPTVDLRVVGFATFAALATGVGVGLWPAIRSRRVSGLDAIRLGHAVADRTRGRRLLVGLELALTLPLLIGAGLALRSLARLLNTDIGLSADRVATAELSFSADRSSTQRLATLEAILGRLTVGAGIDAAGFVNDLPLAGNGGLGARVVPDVGEPTSSPGDAPFTLIARYLTASPGYFRVLGIPLLAGRLFLPGDDSTAPPVAVINERMARTFWPGVDPIGHTFTFSGDPRSFTVVGMVGDVREWGPDRPPPPQMFLSGYASAPTTLALVARGALPADRLLQRLRDAVRFADPSQPVYDVRTMDEVLSASLAPRRTNTTLIGVFGALGLVIAGLGVYGVVSYGVARRTRELGIRSALGADAGRLIRMVIGEMVAVTGVGIGAGLALAWSAGRIAAGQLYGVTPGDPVAFGAATVALLAAVGLATVVPARRAVRVDPATALRTE
jgi:putative ABC transport system permease protein